MLPHDYLIGIFFLQKKRRYSTNCSGIYPVMGEAAVGNEKTLKTEKKEI